MVPILSQTWRNILFAHWEYEGDLLAEKLPEPLELDTHNGLAYLSLVAFTIDSMRPLDAVPLPFAGGFAQLNVRTYVKLGRTPGIFFLSLEAPAPVTALGSRLLYGLPFRASEVTLGRSAQGFELSCDGTTDVRASFWSAGAPRALKSGSLDHWLLERYTCFADGARGLVAADIEHSPWRVSKAEAEFRRNSVAAGKPSLLHYATIKDARVGFPYVPNVRSPASPSPGTM